MARRSRGARELSGGLSQLPPLARPLPSSAAGLYPRKGSGAGQYGSALYPTVVEQYDRSTDFKRWKLGQDYYFGSGRSWADYQVHSLSRFIGGAVDATSKDIVTAFPSSTSSEKAWWSAMRVRGSLVLPGAITADRITLRQASSDPSTHRLVLNVSGILSPQQLGVWRLFIGDPFEDSATGPRYPDDLIERPVGSVQLTLVGVSVSEMSLSFDLSRPVVRVERLDGAAVGGSRGRRVYQSAPAYDPAAPLVFNSSGRRHLVSSFKFFCCCPDHLGGALANFEDPGSGGRIKRLPLPNAARTVGSAWEAEGAGYYRQWRTLPERCDQRRDCKHIHALRWQCGVPWLEPNDYPTALERDVLELEAQQSRRPESPGILDYYRLRGMSLDRYVLALAEVVGLQLFPGGDVRDEIRPDPRPLLWNDGDQPLAVWCRQNDWWLKRGGQLVRIFNAGAGRFEEVVRIGGVSYPVVEQVDPGVPGAPVIVP